MLPRNHCDELIGEDLVLVVIDGNPLAVRILRCKESIVVAWVLEAVLDDYDSGRRGSALLTVAIAFELLYGVEVEFPDRGLVEELNAGNHIIVRTVAVLGLNLLEH